MSQKSAEFYAEMEEGLDIGVFAASPKAMKSKGCSTEEDHDFGAMGQCRKCGTHRKPV